MSGVLFAGQYHDEETNIYYNFNRYYSPELGRYITSDPIGLEGGLNTYAYAGGDSIGAIDPLGLTSTSQALGQAIGNNAGAASSSYANSRGSTRAMTKAAEKHVRKSTIAAAMMANPLYSSYDVMKYLWGEGEIPPLPDMLKVKVDDIVDKLNERDDAGDITIPWPPKKGGKWTCIVRVNGLNRTGGPCPLKFGYGWGRDNDFGRALAKARIMAQTMAGSADTHHNQWRCVGPKGEQRYPTSN